MVGHTEGNDLAVGRGEPIAVPIGRGRDPVHGTSAGLPPLDPWNAATPKVKTPPSEARSPYPPPFGDPHDRLVQRHMTHRAMERGVAIAEDPPSDAANQ